MIRVIACAIFSFLYLSFLTTSASASAFNASDHYDPTPWWLLVAQADTIIAAKIDVPEEEIRLAQKENKYQYVTIKAQELRTLKGKIKPGLLEITFFTEDAPYNVASTHLISVAQKPVIAFLVSAEGKYYFTQTGNSALAAAGEEHMALVAAEVSEQQRILSEWRPDPSIPYFKAVKRLIRKAKSGKQQAEAFRQLEALGSDAVPAIIAQIDDYSPLKERYIALKNRSASAFEEYRQYGPEVMADALAAILNQLTGEDFGSIFNGATDEERNSAIAGWKIYGMKHPAYSNARPSKPDSKVQSP